MCCGRGEREQVVRGGSVSVWSWIWSGVERICLINTNYRTCFKKRSIGCRVHILSSSQPGVGVRRPASRQFHAAGDDMRRESPDRDPFPCCRIPYIPLRAPSSIPAGHGYAEASTTRLSERPRGRHPQTATIRASFDSTRLSVTAWGSATLPVQSNPTVIGQFQMPPGPRGTRVKVSPPLCVSPGLRDTAVHVMVEWKGATRPWRRLKAAFRTTRGCRSHPR